MIRETKPATSTPSTRGATRPTLTATSNFRVVRLKLDETVSMPAYQVRPTHLAMWAVSGCDEEVFVFLPFKAGTTSMPPDHRTLFGSARNEPAPGLTAFCNPFIVAMRPHEDLGKQSSGSTASTGAAGSVRLVSSRDRSGRQLSRLWSSSQGARQRCLTSCCDETPVQTTASITMWDLVRHADAGQSDSKRALRGTNPTESRADCGWAQ